MLRKQRKSLSNVTTARSNHREEDVYTHTRTLHLLSRSSSSSSQLHSAWGVQLDAIELHFVRVLLVLLLTLSTVYNRYKMLYIPSITSWQWTECSTCWRSSHAQHAQHAHHCSSLLPASIRIYYSRLHSNIDLMCIALYITQEWNSTFYSPSNNRLVASTSPAHLPGLGRCTLSSCIVVVIRVEGNDNNNNDVAITDHIMFYRPTAAAAAGGN